MIKFNPAPLFQPRVEKISTPPPRLSTPPPKEKCRPPHLVLDNSNTAYIKILEKHFEFLKARIKKQLYFVDRCHDSNIISLHRHSQHPNVYVNHIAHTFSNKHKINNNVGLPLTLHIEIFHGLIREEVHGGNKMSHGNG